MSSLHDLEKYPLFLAQQIDFTLSLLVQTPENLYPQNQEH